MEYNFSKDLKSIREILGVSQSEFADQIGVEQVTISRNELGKTNPSAKILENVYTFAFAKNIKINKLKEMFWRDDLKKHEKLLFHGAKSKIDGEIDIHRGRHNNDFGQGFYAGERQYRLFQDLRIHRYIIFVLMMMILHIKDMK